MTSVTSDLTPALQVQTAELEGLRGQIVRLQAEKNDLVAMNSELRLKADESLDSFIEVIRVQVKLRPKQCRACGSSSVVSSP